MFQALAEKTFFSNNPGPVSDAHFKTVQTVPPQTQENSHRLKVDSAEYWSSAKDQLTGRSPQAPLTRHDLAKPALVSHFGQAFAQNHVSAEKQARPSSALKTGFEAEDGWCTIVGDSKLSQRSFVSPDEASALTRSLHKQLWQSTPERILCDYNSYPEGLFLEEDGTIVPKPDLVGFGAHAWFEPLARLDFTSRTERDSLENLVSSYSKHRSDVPDIDKHLWQTDALRCRVLFDLLYVAYFLRATDPDKSASMNQEDVAGRQARLMTLETRLKDDVAALRSVDRLLPKLTFKEVGGETEAAQAA